MKLKFDYVIDVMLVLFMLMIIGMAFFVYNHIVWKNVLPVITNQTDTLSVDDIFVAEPLDEVVIHPIKSIFTKSGKPVKQEKSLIAPKSDSKTSLSSVNTPKDNSSKGALNKSSVNAKNFTKTNDNIQTGKLNVSGEKNYVQPKDVQKLDTFRIIMQKTDHALIPYRVAEVTPETVFPHWANKNTPYNSPVVSGRVLNTKVRQEKDVVVHSRGEIDLLREWPEEQKFEAPQQTEYITSQNIKIPEIYRRNVPYKGLKGSAYSPEMYMTTARLRNIETIENPDVNGTKTMEQAAVMATKWNPNSENRVKAITNIQTVSNGKIFTIDDVEFKMIFVKGGTFTMGMPFDAAETYADEKPAHKVSISGTFMIGETEVTQKLWEKVMNSNPSRFKGSSHPVEKVSWTDCQKFIRKLNSLLGQHFRLPTEAEWEYAARGGAYSKGFKYSSSSDVAVAAWYSDNSGGTTHDVKTRMPNELGIYDMSGNVWEWCNDWFGSYPGTSQVNPSGVPSGLKRVYRGGSWMGISERCRSGYRSGDRPDSRSNSLGFRLAL